MTARQAYSDATLAAMAELHQERQWRKLRRDGATVMHDDKLGTWVAGYIGTADYRRDMREARQARQADNVATLHGKALATGSGFEGMQAPGFDIEHSTQTVSGACGEYGIVPRETRAIIAATRRETATRMRRQAVMSLARVREAHRRRVLASQRVSAAYVVAPRILKGYPRPLDRYAALDEWVMNRDREHAAMERLMQSEPNRDGRGVIGETWETAGTRQALVNGTEVRNTPRWTGTPRVAVMTAVETRHGVTCVAPVDWTAYRVHADGTREALASSRTATRRKRGRKPKGAADATYAARLALLGADLSLAEG